jgi:hypothetical protein
MSAEVVPHLDFEAMLSAERAHAHSLDLLALMLLCQRERAFTPTSRA